MSYRKVLPLALLLPLLAVTSCAHHEEDKERQAAASESSSRPSPSQSLAVPMNTETPYTPTPEERARDRENCGKPTNYIENPAMIRDECEGPYMNWDDIERGKAEGNIYVIYSGVMCFGGTLAPVSQMVADDKADGTQDKTLEEHQAEYDAIPLEVREQSDLNQKGNFVPPQACLDAGWSRAGGI